MAHAHRTKNAHPLIRKVLAREFITQMLFFGIPIGVATTLAIFLFYHVDVQMAEQHLMQTEHHHRNLREEVIRQNVESAVAGLRLLATLHDPHGLASTGQEELLTMLANSYLVFCQHFRNFRQIGTMRLDGQELNRVACRTPRPLAVKPRGPEEIAKSGLSPALSALGPADVFVSAIVGLAGQDEGDPKVIPVVQLATRLRSGFQGDPIFVVVDVDLRRLISDVILDTGQGGTMILVEPDGRYVRNPAPGEGWGDTVVPGQERRFAEKFPEVWARLQQVEEGFVETPDGVFSFFSLQLAEARPSNVGKVAGDIGAPTRAPQWRIVSHVPDAQLATGRIAAVRKFMLLIPAPLLVTLYLAHAGVRRRRTVLALEQSESSLRQIMDSVVDGIVTTNTAGRIERANAATLSLFGVETPYARPRELSQLLPPDKLAGDNDVARLWRGEERERRVARATLDLQRQDGATFPAEVVLMETELDDARRFIWVIRDVSELRELESKRDAERMRFFHQSKMAEIGLLAAGIIHEVGNPIAAISGMVSQLSEEVEQDTPVWSARAREHLKMIAYQAQRLAAITREISDFTRARPGVLELFDLNSLVRSTTRLVQYDARWRRIQMGLNLDTEIPALMGIQDQIAQVLMNLLVNAGDAVQERPPDDRRVTVATALHNRDVVLSVTDNGHGMSEETKRQAFDSFYTTKPEGKGTGLGLTMCQTIVAAHHGRIEIESGEGLGAAFCVYLPVPKQAESLAG